MIFQMNDFAVLGNFTTHINKMWAEGKTPLVTVSDKTIDRSKSQNALMHKWFKDIDKSTGHGFVYEGGRCKERYFFPLLKASEDQAAKMAYFTIRVTYKELERRGLIDRFYEMLMNGSLSSTSLLSVKEFTEALRNMQLGEAQHKLTNPDTYGMRWVQ